MIFESPFSIHIRVIVCTRRRAEYACVFSFQHTTGRPFYSPLFPVVVLIQVYRINVFVPAVEISLSSRNEVWKYTIISLFKPEPELEDYLIKKFRIPPASRDGNNRQSNRRTFYLIGVRKSTTKGVRSGTASPGLRETDIFKLQA